MNQEPPAATQTSYFKPLVIGSLVVLAGAVGWLAYRVENLPAQQPAAAKTTASKQNEQAPAVGWDTTIQSGKKAFQITFPDGWGPLLKPLNSDALILGGTAQPTVAAGKKVVVRELDGYGGDSASLFSVWLLDKTATPPKGDKAEFTIGKGDTAITGKKYTYQYSKDDVIGVGTQRLQGDRDYEYVFPAGTKELHVFYSVYGSDPRNQIVTVDQIVHSIILN